MILENSVELEQIGTDVEIILHPVSACLNHVFVLHQASGFQLIDNRLRVELTDDLP